MTYFVMSITVYDLQSTSHAAHDVSTPSNICLP